MYDAFVIKRKNGLLFHVGRHKTPEAARRQVDVRLCSTHKRDPEKVWIGNLLIVPHLRRGSGSKTVVGFIEEAYTYDHQD